MSNDLTEVTSWAELENKEQFSLRLESIVQVHDKWVPHVREHIPFRLCISYQILPQDLSFAQGFHGIQFPRVLVSDEEHITETSTA